MNMFDFNEIPAEGERWMQFAQDFMQNLGLSVESPPWRDAENLYDFVAVEQVPGKFNPIPIRWLVSCRHKAATRTSVRESDEMEILDRVLRCRADGFIGFYSTSVAPTLEARLSEMKSQSQIRDYRFFDMKIIGTYLSTPGFARVVTRYFPNYAKTYGVLHLTGDGYQPIRCENCNRDLLESLFTGDRRGVVVGLRRRKTAPDEIEVIADMYTACKGECDEQLQAKYCKDTILDAANWADLSELITPPVFLDHLVTLIDRLGNDGMSLTAKALEKEKYLIRALAQCVLRETSDGERAKKIRFDG